MESGQRKDAAGRAIPAWHITNVTASLNGREVLSTEWGPGMAHNPFLQFNIRNAKVGDKVAVSWRDSRGQARTDEAVVQA